MISKVQGVLTKSGSTVKSLAGSHPIVLGVIIGVGAYFVVSKYWLNPEEDEEINAAEEAESNNDAPA